MADSPHFEGWKVRWRTGAILALIVFGFIAATLLLMGVLYRADGAPVVQVGGWQVFPEPTLNARMDRDPQFSFALPPGQPTPPDQKVEAAMRALAAQGQAAYGPKDASP